MAQNPAFLGHKFSTMHAHSRTHTTYCCTPDMSMHSHVCPAAPWSQNPAFWGPKSRHGRPPVAKDPQQAQQQKGKKKQQEEEGAGKRAREEAEGGEAGAQGGEGDVKKQRSD
jgi:hypothetical protein